MFSFCLLRFLRPSDSSSSISCIRISLSGSPPNLSTPCLYACAFASLGSNQPIVCLPFLTSKKAPITLPIIANGADSSMFFTFLTPGLSLSAVLKKSGKGILPFGPNVSGNILLSSVVILSSSPTSLNANTVASTPTCVIKSAASFVNQGLVNNAPPANLALTALDA